MPDVRLRDLLQPPAGAHAGAGRGAGTRRPGRRVRAAGVLCRTSTRRRSACWRRGVRGRDPRRSGLLRRALDARRTRGRGKGVRARPDRSTSSSGRWTRSSSTPPAAAHISRATPRCCGDEPVWAARAQRLRQQGARRQRAAGCAAAAGGAPSAAARASPITTPATSRTRRGSAPSRARCCGASPACSWSRSPTASSAAAAPAPTT